MRIIDIPQRSPEWRQIKRGVVTASEIGEWIVEQPKVRLRKTALQALLSGLGVEFAKSDTVDTLQALVPPDICAELATFTETYESARLKLAARKIAQVGELVEEPDFTTWAVDYGLTMEPEAFEAYADETGREVEPVGFVYSDDELFGCSPDGFVADRRGLIETKCPMGRTHVEYLLRGEVPDQYAMQIQMQLAVTGCEFVDFYSYCPSAPSLLIRVEADEKTEALKLGLRRFGEYYRKQLARMSELWNGMRENYARERD